MGSSLSRQERLFVSRQWPQLLDDAARADVAAYDDDVHGRRTPTSDFRLSFNEWQAFLALLESHRGARSSSNNNDDDNDDKTMATAMAASSQLCASLTRAQLHCPLVVLAVHVCAWWCDAIDAPRLRARIAQLQQLMHNDTATTTMTATTRTHSESSASDHNNDDDDSNDDGSQPGRRARLTSALRRQLVSGRQRLHRLRRNNNNNNNDNNNDSSNNNNDNNNNVDDMRWLYARETMQAMALVEHMLRSRSSRTATTTAIVRDHDDNDADARAARATAQTQRRAYDALATAVGRERPVVHVALALILAVVAAAAPPSPSSLHDALAGVAALRALTTTLSQTVALDDDDDDNNNNGDSGAAERDRTHSRVCVPLDEWPLLARLDRALARRQRAHDAVDCASSRGRRVADALAAARRARAPRAPLSSLSPSARWDVCASQFVGQHHVWQALKAFFVEADLVEREKATVLVLFGPSGYGKSEVAKRIAAALHPLAATLVDGTDSGSTAAAVTDSDNVASTIDALEASGQLVYIHLPSFCTREGIYSLVDPPAAHVGDGMLLSALHRHRDAVVVLDEFEKGTAEAVQHLWLSAFQKRGTLRSLKDAARSVSTVRTTFVLTCNLVADVIEAQAERYLASSPAERAAMRDAYARRCRQCCVAELGEPFANRVDAFLPFVPYTDDERTQFVYLQLERLLSAQAARGRVVHVTPRFVDALVRQLHTFHAATVEAVVRPLLAAMATRRVRAAVVTVEERASGTRYVLLPAYTRDVTANNNNNNNNNNDDDSAQLYVNEAWEALPGGEAVLRQWRDDDGDDDGDDEDEQQQQQQQRRSGNDDDTTTATRPRRDDDAAHRASPATAAMTTRDGGGGGMLHERCVQLHTTRELALERELVQVKQTLRQRELELSTLRRTLTLLQKALALLLCTLVCCVVVLYTLLGVKLTLLLVGVVAFVAFVLLRLPLRVVYDALRVAYHVLGPRRAALLLAVAMCWLASAARRAVARCA